MKAEPVIAENKRFHLLLWLLGELFGEVNKIIIALPLLLKRMKAEA